MNIQEQLDRTFIFDIETTPESQYLKEGRVKAWLCYLSNRSRTITHLCLNLEEMLNHLITNAPNGLNIVYSHNGSHFDMEFMGDWLYKNFTPYNDKENFISKENINQFSYIITPNRIMEITLVIKDKMFKFRDTKMMFPLSVSQMEGMLIGEDKHNKTPIDYSKEHYETSLLQIPENEIIYMKKDVDIVIDFIDKMEKDLNEVLDYNEQFNMYESAMTASSETMKRFINHSSEKVRHRDNIKPDHAKNKVKKIFKIDNALWDNISSYYNGGMTYVNPDKKEMIHNNVVQYDVNSMYPGVMVNERLPYGAPLTVNKLNSNNPNTFKFYKVKLLKNVSIKNGYHPFIPFKNEKGTAEHIKTIEFAKYRYVYLPQPLYEQFIKYYDVVEGFNIETEIEFIFRAKVLFKDYINNWETIKAKGGFYKVFAKIMMNGLYGKWAQKREMEGKRLVPYNQLIFNMKQSQIRNKPRLGEYVLLPDTSESKNPYYIPIACAITGYARSLLVEGIQNNRERFLYCDTDSIHLQGHEPAKGIEIHKSKFGAWGIEWKAERAIYIRAKRYMVELPNNRNKITLAGFNKYQPNSLEEFQFDCLNGRVIKNATQGRKKVKGGVIIKLKDKTLKGNNINEVNK